mmetsp:Transcript_56919/g.159761  ORF Transcript_56919/g.159761 Transcript_56919/m.159761 type:complete len:90 (-) Transcript_56919:184-453(-)
MVCARRSQGEWVVKRSHAKLASALADRRPIGSGGGARTGGQVVAMGIGILWRREQRHYQHQHHGAPDEWDEWGGRQQCQQQWQHRPLAD